MQQRSLLRRRRGKSNKIGPRDSYNPGQKNGSTGKFPFVSKVSTVFGCLTISILLVRVEENARFRDELDIATVVQ
jgi:hypothetical protein